MRGLRVVLVVLAALLLAAHLYRRGSEAGAAAGLLLPSLLLVHRSWARRTLQVILALGALEWLRTLWVLAQVREAAGQPWIRMAVILGAAGLVTALGAWLAGRPGERPPEVH